jgi:MFS family permease
MMQSGQGITVAQGGWLAAANYAGYLGGALLAIRGGRRLQTAASAADDIWKSIGAGIRYLMGHETMRFLFVVMAVVNFLFTGPLLVGIPVLADQRLPEGARAFGFLMSAYAGGTLAGMIFAGLVSKPSGRILSAILIGQLVAFGLVLIGMGWITSTWLAVTLMLLLGIGNGYINIIVLTWIQQRTPRDMLGRVMSMVLLAGMGLVPLSQVLAGAVGSRNLALLFALAGGLLLLTTLWAALQPALKALSHEIVSSGEAPVRNEEYS